MQLFMRIDADCGGTIDWEVRRRLEQGRVVPLIA